MPEVRRIAARAAHGGDLHLLAGRVIPHAEHKALQAVGAGGDLIDVHHAFDLLDQAFDTDAPGEAKLLFELVEHQVHKDHVRRPLGLGEHQGVELGASPGHHLDDVVVAPFRFHVVDAHADGARTAIPSC